MRFWIATFCILALCLAVSAEQCGKQAGYALCPNGLCCSQYGWCGTTAEYCTTNCQSQCGGSGDVGSIITESVFNEMLKHRNDVNCKSNGFYTYSAFRTAAQSFSSFGSTGSTEQRKQELAAFLAQTSHETTGGWATAPDGPYSWGYCFISEINQGTFCSSPYWPCAAGQQYYGRGPIQLTHNYNYGQAGNALGVDLINYPNRVATDAIISFKTALWFWMTPQSNKPSSHDVITGRWTPSAQDIAANRVPGYGVTTNIINGGVECNIGVDSRVVDRIGFYKRYCNILGVGYGNNLDCYSQMPFA